MTTTQEPEFKPGTRKRRLEGKVFFFPCYKMVIQGNPMETWLNTACSTRSKARTIAKNYIKNIGK
jgi:hypothetical protein